MLTAQVYPGVSLLTAQLTKCDGIFSDPKGLVLWKGESSARAIQSKAKEKLSPFYLSKDLNTCYPVEVGRGTPIF